mmetsp:Transcript_1441/g.1974  ORF Transcript_1441/g.1974 Transcript_1441/m.1974 type:complete len:647 (-) Transcript_1441:1301-3241(-)
MMRTVAEQFAFSTFLLAFLYILHPSRAFKSTPTDDTHVRSFFDSHVPKLMNEANTVGMVVSAVYKGRIIFKKGHGHGNLEQKIPVSPDKTLFRPGSISKLITFTAVMQLVEQGKIDLNEDINTYLDLKIQNDTFTEPITMLHLMSHTAGYEDFIFNLFVKDPKKLLTLEQAVKDRKLQRILPPGKEIAYSNYGVMIAGYIIELISGMPFENYVEKFILGPLSMKSSTFRQPLPKKFEQHMSIGYSHDGKNARPHEFELIQGTPAGGLTATATDIARFLLAHLSPDSVNNILKPATMRKMHSTLFRQFQGINGMAHGFIELNTNGERIIGHSGDTIYFHSLCFIMPERNFGVYFSSNTMGNAGPRDAVTTTLFQQFMDNFSPAPTGAELSKGFQSSTDHSAYVGDHLTNRRSESDFSKLLMSLSFNVKVQADHNKPCTRISSQGTVEMNCIQILSFDTMKMEDYVEIAPGLFQKVDGQARVAFLTNDEGKVDKLIGTLIPVMLFKRPPWWESPLLNVLVLGSGFIILFLGLFCPPIGLISIFLPKNEQERAAMIARCLAFAVVTLYFSFAISAFISFGSDFLFMGPLPIQPFFYLKAAVVMSLPLPFLAVFAVKRRFWSSWSRFFYTLFAVVINMISLLLCHWKFIS